jgi:hypothetical protein
MSVRNSVKTIQNLMRQDAGVDGDAQRILSRTINLQVRASTPELLLCCPICGEGQHFPPNWPWPRLPGPFVFGEPKSVSGHLTSGGVLGACTIRARSISVWKSSAPFLFVANSERGAACL